MDINTKKLKKNAFRVSKVRGLTASRVRVPGGCCNADVMQQVVDIARKYGNGQIHLTTRQGFEIEGIHMEDIILIPQSATQEIQDKKFVYVLQSDNTLKHTEIQVSNLNDGKNYIVIGGLKPGDKIVVEGVQTLKDGQTITPITPEQKEAEPPMDLPNFLHDKGMFRLHH